MAKIKQGILLYFLKFLSIHLVARVTTLFGSSICLKFNKNSFHIVNVNQLLFSLEIILIPKLSIDA